MRGIAKTAGIQAIFIAKAVATIAPMTIWPSAPMLKSPALNPKPTARPVRIKGVVLIITEAIANFDPKAPLKSAV